MRFIAPLTILIGLSATGGCPLDTQQGTPAAGDPTRLIPNDFDGLWQVVSETGLINNCITILGDRVTQFSECNGVSTLLRGSEPSVRSGNQIIWTFEVESADGVLERHTVSVFIQPDNTLSGDYSIRRPGQVFALTDGIIMVVRRVRI